ncbi:hypothetical protein P886_0677 [Alteromonadaceae bacterium 2753L.S.0a.02]|nr:hypothetical protein P886_0677 [Alteromonadaceae bacterium 2753L.S.0a.02]
MSEAICVGVAWDFVRFKTSTGCGTKFEHGIYRKFCAAACGAQLQATKEECPARASLPNFKLRFYKSNTKLMVSSIKHYMANFDKSKLTSTFLAIDRAIPKLPRFLSITT